MSNAIKESDFIFYTGQDGKVHAQVILGSETVWVNQQNMSEVFGVQRPAITKHLQNIFLEGELVEDSVCSILEHTATDGKVYKTKFYNLDAIIAVGYRVNSYKATQFRIWATRILKEYLIKGFAMDDERLKQGNRLFGKDYFKELLERIREIRASEKMFYEKVTELYATSIDYNKNDPETHRFFAKVQAKLEYAVVGKTPSEIVHSRADSTKPNMGLTTWKNAKKEGNIILTDVTIAKNYLTKEEITNLNILVSSFLDHAEMIVSRNKLMKMADWAERLDKFLDFNEYKVLTDAGKVKKELADAYAKEQYKKYKPFQDEKEESDFSKWAKEIKNSGHLPTEEELLKSDKDELSDFNAKVKTELKTETSTTKVAAKKTPKRSKQ
jgi:hypothetical protein